jgi:hypothetical protein
MDEYMFLSSVLLDEPPETIEISVQSLNITISSNKPQKLVSQIKVSYLTK